MRAGKWFSIGVHQHVSFELELCTELLIADFTGDRVYVNLVSELIVLLQRLQGGVSLLTV